MVSTWTEERIKARKAEVIGELLALAAADAWEKAVEQGSAVDPSNDRYKIQGA